MPTLFQHSPKRRSLRLICLLAAAVAMPWPLAATELAIDDPVPMQARPTGQDQTMVLVRKVHPRIAYRGLAATENPAHVRATTFPGRVFHSAVDRLERSLVDDVALAELGTAGLPDRLDIATGFKAWPGAAGERSGHGAVHVPLGAGASVTGVTGGLGRVIGGRIEAALGAGPVGGGR